MKPRGYVILSDLLTAKSPSNREELFYFSERTPQAAPVGVWKSHFITEHDIAAETCAALPCVSAGAAIVRIEEIATTLLKTGPKVGGGQAVRKDELWMK